MPECRIGMFPDAGASFFLQHLKGSAMCLPGFLGMFLALTGERLRGATGRDFELGRFLWV